MEELIPIKIDVNHKLCIEKSSSSHELSSETKNYKSVLAVTRTGIVAYGNYSEKNR